MAKNDAFARNRKLQYAMAFDYAEAYCRKHSLSVEKLKTQRFEPIVDMLVFVQPTGIAADGLCNDFETRPWPTLVVKLGGDGKVLVEETEHTRKYLVD